MIETLDHLDFDGRQDTASCQRRWRAFKAVQVERLERLVALMEAMGLGNPGVQFQRERLQELRSKR